MSEKMVAKEAETFLTKIIDNEEYCQCYFRSNILNLLTKAWQSPLNSEMPGVYSSIPVACTASGAPYLKVGQNIYKSKVRVSDIRMENINELVTGSGNYSGDLVVEMDTSRMVRPIKNITTKMVFHVDPATGAFQACSSSSSIKLPDPDLVWIAVNRNSTNSTTTPVNLYNFCALTSVQSGGDDGGGSDRCEVSYNTFAKNWTLSGRRGDDPQILCKMYCYR